MNRSTPLSRHEMPDFQARWVVSFTQLLGRPPSDHELREINRIRDALDLRDNDALWLIIMALQYFRQNLEASVTETLGHLKQVADATAQASLENAKREFQRDFPPILREIARNITSTTTKPNWRRWEKRFLRAGFATSLFLLALLGLSWLAYDQGWREGYRIAWSQLQTYQPKTPP